MQEMRGKANNTGRSRRQNFSAEEEKELEEIFIRTYGKVERKMPPESKTVASVPEKRRCKKEDAVQEFLLVDGYNVIFAWDDLKELAKINIEAARNKLMDILCNYQGFRKCVVILVFDAYKVEGYALEIQKYHNIHVVYTKEAETADAYIEKASYKLSREGQRVRVATADFAEQLIILGHGALRVSAQELREEVERTQGEIARIIADSRTASRGGAMRAAFEKARN